MKLVLALLQTLLTDTLSRDEVISNSSGNTSKINFGSGEKEVFCTVPAKKAMSPVMEATGYVVTHASTLDEVQTMDSGVLARTSNSNRNNYSNRKFNYIIIEYIRSK